MPNVGITHLVTPRIYRVSPYTRSCVVGTFFCVLLKSSDLVFSIFQPPPSGRQSPTKNTHNGSPSKCPRFVKIKNWETGSVLHDTLHLKTAMVSRAGQNSLSIVERVAVIPRWIYLGMQKWKNSVLFPVGFEF